jgi:hypothetical protein
MADYNSNRSLRRSNALAWFLTNSLGPTIPNNPVVPLNSGDYYVRIESSLR